MLTSGLLLDILLKLTPEFSTVDAFWCSLLNTLIFLKIEMGGQRNDHQIYLKFLEIMF